MPDLSNEDLVRRYFAAHLAYDYDQLGAMRHDGWTCEWPQTGERVVGRANDRAIMDNWPGGLPVTDRHVNITGTEDRWVVTPAFTVQRVAGSGDAWWLEGHAAYPDGSVWFFGTQLKLRDGKIYWERWLFGPPLEAPAWRAAWVERFEETPA